MFAVHNTTTCDRMSHGNQNTGRVEATLHCYCEDVPAWVSAEAFLSPSATILLAILAVILFYSFRRLRALFFKVPTKVFERVFSAAKVSAQVAELVKFFTAFEKVHPRLQKWLEDSLRPKLSQRGAQVVQREESDKADILGVDPRFLKMPSMVIDLEKQRCVRWLLV